jgi:hypothetical protein
MSHADIFSSIYEQRRWGKDIRPNFKGNSGSGSALEFNTDYIAFLKKFFVEKDIKSVVDMGCGDWRCGKAIYEGTDIDYLGYDVYEPLLRHLMEAYECDKWKFKYLDCGATLNETKNADLLIVKDVLQHWTDEEVKAFMEFQKTNKKYKYILITNCSFKMNGELKVAGGWRTLNAEHPLLAEYGLVEMLKYQSKSCLLWTM